MCIIYEECFSQKYYAGNGKTIKSSITDQKIKRNYRLYLPENYFPSKAMPLLIVLHGRFGTGKGMIRFAAFNPLADKEGIIIAYPDGYKRSWHDARNHGPASDKGIDDVAFISRLIDTISARYAVDRSRVYVAGMSNGGFMALTLACALPDKIAAVASVTGSMAPDPGSWCKPDKAVSILLIPGTMDPIVPFTGGEISNGNKTIAFSAVADFWAENNKCNKAPVLINLPDNFNDGTSVRKIFYTACEQNSTVEMYCITGGGHTWPGGLQYLPEARIGRVCKEIQAEEIIVHFLLQHQNPR